MTRIACLCLCLGLLASGCVSRQAFDAKVSEAEQLAASVASLETDFNRALEQQETLVTANSGLKQELSEAQAVQSTLRADLLRSRADIERLEKILSARSAEAGAALAEMRQTIEQLTEEKRALQQQAEQEQRARESRMEQLQSTYDSLVQRMEEEIARGEVTISELQGKLTLNLVERILFDSGQAELNRAGRKLLARVGAILKGAQDKDIRIEGHTDNVPISPRLQSVYPSNWELAAARALHVVRFLEEEANIPGERLAASSFGEHRPIASNASAAGRAQNRRIQIVLVPHEATLVKPLEPAAP